MLKVFTHINVVSAKWPSWGTKRDSSKGFKYGLFWALSWNLSFFTIYSQICGKTCICLHRLARLNAERQVQVRILPGTQLSRKILVTCSICNVCTVCMLVPSPQEKSQQMKNIFTKTWRKDGTLAEERLLTKMYRPAAKAKVCGRILQDCTCTLSLMYLYRPYSVEAIRRMLNCSQVLDESDSQLIPLSGEAVQARQSTFAGIVSILNSLACRYGYSAELAYLSRVLLKLPLQGW
jgi:hypothetical protein